MEKWEETLVKVSSLLMESRDYKKTLLIITEQVALLSGACRACAMLEDGGGFVIEAGFPVDGHGIDVVLTPDTGEGFLREIIANGSIVVVDEPKADGRTQYMRELAIRYDMTKVVFIPLTYQGESLGVLVLDFCNGKCGHELPTDRIQLLANLASSAIGSEHERRRNEVTILRMERMNAIGEQVAGIAHTIRNGLDLKIGAWARRMVKKLAGDVDPECLTTRAVLESGASIILEEVEALERFVNDLLRFATPEKCQAESTPINTFLLEKVRRIIGVKTEFDLDKRLEEVSVKVDPDLMSSVIDDLTKNALQAQVPGRELVLTVRTRYSRRQGCVFIQYGNNGEKIEEGYRTDIFSPFFTTKADGTGLGLPRAKAVLNRHGGDIRVVKSTDEQTVFEITLPVSK